MATAPAATPRTIRSGVESGPVSPPVLETRAVRGLAFPSRSGRPPLSESPGEVLRLPLAVLVGGLCPLTAFHLDKGVEQRVAHRRPQRVTRRQFVQGVGKCGRQALDTAVGALGVRQRSGIAVEWFAWVEPPLDAVETGREQAQLCEVRVHRAVGGLELHPGRPLAGVAGDGGHADDRLAVVVPPAGVRRGPHPRREPVVRLHRRRRQRHQRGSVLHEASDERPSGVAQRVGPLARGVEQGVLAVAPQRQVDVTARPRQLRERLRPERRPQVVVGGDALDRLSDTDVVVGCRHALGVVDDEFLLARTVLRVVRRQAHPLLFERVHRVEDDIVSRPHPVGGEAGAVVERLDALLTSRV